MSDEIKSTDRTDSHNSPIIIFWLFVFVGVLGFVILLLSFIFSDTSRTGWEGYLIISLLGFGGISLMAYRLIKMSYRKRHELDEQN